MAQLTFISKVAIVKYRSSLAIVLIVIIDESYEFCMIKNRPAGSVRKRNGRETEIKMAVILVSRGPESEAESVDFLFLAAISNLVTMHTHKVGNGIMK